LGAGVLLCVDESVEKYGSRKRLVGFKAGVRPSCPFSLLWDCRLKVTLKGLKYFFMFLINSTFFLF